MTTRTDYHSETAREFLVEARAYFAEGDLLQASEKGWGAAAQPVKAVAEARGWSHRSHRDLYRAVDRLVEESSDQRIQSLFLSANALHQNFYEGWMTAAAVSAGLSDVERLTTRLQRLLV